MTYVVLVLGKTGVGKSSLINGLKNKIECKVSEDSTSGTKEFQVIDLIKGDDHYQFIDTPGLLSAGKGEDEEYKNEIKKAVSEFRGLKCILLLFNLTDTRLDGPTFQMLQSYINMFPVKYFWENVIIVYTNASSNNRSGREKIEKKRGTFEKDIKEKDEFKEFRQFMDEKNINYPYKMGEFFVDSQKYLEDIDNKTKSVYEDLLKKIKELPKMFEEIKHLDRDELSGENTLIPQIKTFRKIVFKPRYGNIIESKEFLFKQADKTNLDYSRSIYDYDYYYKKVRCRKVKIKKIYETKVYKLNGKEIYGNKNYIGEEEA